MKKLKLIILLLLLQFSINAQTYMPMPTTYAVWTIATTIENAPASGYKYGMYGDTMINNMNYKKIYENNDSNFNISSPLTFYSGAIRELGKTVYWIQSGSNVEGVLYDFNLQVGDTASSFHNGFVIKNVISGLSSIVYNGTIYKKWIFQSTGEFWLEGIGSSNGLLNSLIGQAIDGCQSLVCLSIDGIIQYNASPTCLNASSQYNCDGVFNTVSVPEINSKSNNLLLFPNPFSSSAILKTTIELNDAKLKVFDILGQEVLILGHLKGQEIKIIKGNLNSGNYYYHLTQNGNLVSKGKFIVE